MILVAARTSVALLNVELTKNDVFRVGFKFALRIVAAVLSGERSGRVVQG